jgi:hypothetical protein
MKKTTRIAILGAGIMGCSAALALAKRGAAVTLFDAADQPLTGASRWNEGKIHLGYLYSADPSLATARHVLPGSLCFKPLVERLVGCSITAATSQNDDLFLCHRDSVVSPQDMYRYFDQVSLMLREHPCAQDYLVDARQSRVQRLTQTQLSQLTDHPDIVAGFSVPERSVSTRWLADRYIEAMLAERHIEIRCGLRIQSVRRPASGGDHGPWRVVTQQDEHGPYDIVINALWEGRCAIDLTVGLPPPSRASNRYRLALFIRTSKPVHHPCVLIATGPFGDIKNYNNRDFYLSWYPTGLRIDSQTAMPPPTPLLTSDQEASVVNEMLEQLCAQVPGVADVVAATETRLLRGGWVFAAAQGVLSDPNASLHQRASFGVTQLGSYYSIDTGKYSTAPWLADNLAHNLLC